MKHKIKLYRTDKDINYPINIAIECSALDNQELIAMWQHATRVLHAEEQRPWTVAYCAAEAYVRAVEKEYTWRGLPKEWLREELTLPSIPTPERRQDDETDD